MIVVVVVDNEVVVVVAVHDIVVVFVDVDVELVFVVVDVELVIVFLLLMLSTSSMVANMSPRYLKPFSFDFP